jgi:hypothetical protein
MPTFIKPGRVIVDEGGSSAAIAVLAAGVALAAISSIAAAVMHALILILIGLAALVTLGIAWLIHILRRDGMHPWRPPPPAQSTAPRCAIPARLPLAIEPQRPLRGDADCPPRSAVPDASQDRAAGF